MDSKPLKDILADLSQESADRNDLLKALSELNTAMEKKAVEVPDPLFKALTSLHKQVREEIIALTGPQITHVAIKYNNELYSLPAPNRHPDVIRKMKGVYGPHQCGFLTEEGKYLNRKDAMKLAKTNGQVKKGSPYWDSETELYSEDLW